ncbi:hypothetical protein L6164_011353 [Bauhinia variegata]|nr:hypothetical protein L6164_011353 [Bauhinia variegata]
MPLSQEGLFPGTDHGSFRQSRPRRRSNNFHNSLFGMMSAANKGKGERDLLFPSNYNNARNVINIGACAGAARVTISCPQKDELGSKLVLLPPTLKELLEMGADKFGVVPTKVITEDGAEVDDMDVIRDGDRLLLVAATVTATSQSNSSKDAQAS